MSVNSGIDIKFRYVVVQPKLCQDNYISRHARSSCYNYRSSNAGAKVSRPAQIARKISLCVRLQPALCARSPHIVGWPIHLVSESDQSANKLEE